LKVWRGCRVMGIEIGPPIRRQKSKLSGWYPGKIIREILGQRFLGQVFVSGTYVDSEIERMIEAKKSEWKAKGYREGLIDMAEQFARSWIAKMTEAFSPPELRQAVARYITPKALEAAESWLKAMSA